MPPVRYSQNQYHYDSDYIGKKAFVEEKLAPLILALGQGWTDVTYYVTGYNREYVGLTNANLDKCKEINVSCDSISALAQDVLKTILNIF